MKKKISFLVAEILILILSDILIGAKSQSSSVPVPEIRPVFYEKEWQDGMVLGKFVLHSSQRSKVILSCKAPYPIAWNLSRNIDPLDTVNVYGKRDMANSIFYIYMDLFSSASNNSLDFVSTDVICEKEDDPQVENRISLFVHGNHSTLFSERGIVTDSKVIPCFSTDPFRDVKLYQLKPSGTVELVESATYHPVHGFLANRIFEGLYICRKQNYRVNVSALVSHPNYQEFEFWPEHSSVKAFTDESIQIKCTSRRSHVKLNVDEIDNVAVSISDIEYGQAAIIFAEMFNGSQDGSRMWGNVSCFEMENGKENLVRTWEYEFFDPPTLHLDDAPACSSRSEVYALEIGKCESVLSCRLWKRMLDSRTHSTGVQFGILDYPETERDSAGREEHARGHWFVSKIIMNNKHPISFLRKYFSEMKSLLQGQLSLANSTSKPNHNGIARCTLVGGLSKTWMFFQPLYSDKLSLNWNEVSRNELISLSKKQDVLYSNETNYFRCSALAYLFQPGINFVLEYANSSLQVLDDIFHRSASVPYRITRKTEGANKVLTASLWIHLPMDAVAMHCTAMWQNSTEVLVDSARFRIEYLQAACIHDSDILSEEVFYTNGEKPSIACPVSGEPPPDVQWTFQRYDQSWNPLIDFFPHVKEAKSDGKYFLQFSYPAYKYAGLYTCTAENFLGRIEKKFNVTVSEPPPKQMSGEVAYSTVTLPVVVAMTVLLVIVLFFAVAAVVFRKRYENAKERLRALTSGEIQEFMEGKPELLKDAGKLTSMDTIDFLPYNAEYEVPKEDIELEKDYLGSGQFSYVVRAKILSREKDVAAKITKSTVNVTLFKSLLSEVKIMIYVGDHKNIVKLVGVCTESIRNRCIYILTEICEMGSLENFLLGARSSFDDLIGQSKTIDRSLETGSATLTTLDLVRFSVQIASGMEYLSSKSVVHADLAARNVLVTSNKDARISDFGLSRQLYSDTVYVKKSKVPLPWRWLAPEVLSSMVFSTHSDVWSYGATLYEIFTLGDKPFPNETWNSDFVISLQNGLRMGRPKFSTTEIYTGIVCCWETEPTNRPNFSVLKALFEHILAENGIPVENETSHEPEYTDTEPIYQNLDTLPLQRRNLPESYINTQEQIEPIHEGRSVANFYLNS